MNTTARIKYTRHSVRVGKRADCMRQCDFYIATFERTDRAAEELGEPPTVLAVIETSQWADGSKRWHVQFTDSTADAYIDSLPDVKEEIEKRAQAALARVFSHTDRKVELMLAAAAGVTVSA